MTRLLSTMRCDVRLQQRNGFYWAVAFLLATFVVVMTRLPSINWTPILPPLLLGNLMMAAFYFMGGLMLLEKGEGTLESLIVTPLTSVEYLLSKVLTLTALSLAESYAIVLVAHGPAFNWLLLLAGVALAAALYCLVGFIVVIRYDSINEYLFPTMIYSAIFFLPILDYAGVWGGPWMYLHPFQAPLVLLEAAFYGTGSWVLGPWMLVYGVVYSLLWVALLLFWSMRVFRRFVVARAGVST